MSSGRCGMHMTPLQVVPGQSEQPTYCPDCKVEALERDLAALRQRHAEAVERAWREGYFMGFDESDEQPLPMHEREDIAWLASEAKAALKETP